MNKYVRLDEVRRAVLHNEGQAVIAAIDDLKTYNPHDIMREMLIDAQIDREAEYERGKRDAVVHGEWIGEHDGYKWYGKCSVCSHEFSIDSWYADMNYCPNCGAKMKGESDV